MKARANRLARHIRRLASDEFEGRFPGSRGEELTLAYLQQEFRAAGLQTGPSGNYLQRVPLVGIRPAGRLALRLRGEEGTRTLQHKKEFVAWSKQLQEQVALEDSDLVYVGYGVVAPEYGWNDYKGVDVRGKTLIVLVSDPPVPDPADPTQPDPTVFKGKALTYYGRWTYKLEEAARQGARGCFIVHETGPAGYPWEVVERSWCGEQFDLASGKVTPHGAVEGWLSREAATGLFRQVGLDLESLKQTALNRNFRPLPLELKASILVESRLRAVESHNLVARVPGRDARLEQEHLIYVSHWDHLGRDTSLEGDQIYNGAVDNATGTAGLLELARSFAALETPPNRSLLFLSVTGEEQGLLGSRHYAENPLYPLQTTLAALNMDAMNVLGPTCDLTIIGLGQTTLDPLVEEVARKLGRTIRPDPEPEKGFYFRSDHFSFARQGVPSLYIDPGIEYRGRPQGWGLEQRRQYTRQHYHKPSDEYHPDWDLSGQVLDLEFLFELGYQAAERQAGVQWQPESEFRPRREKMLGKARPTR